MAFCFVLLFFSISDVHQPLSQIRISLAGSLGAGQIIFLAGFGATENTVRSLFKVSRVVANLGDYVDMMK